MSTSCYEGLKLFDLSQPDLVLIDINLGSEDGREMWRTIKTQAGYRHIPVVFMSANREALATHPIWC